MSSRLMKNTTHNNSVASVLPPLKRCRTGIPASSGSSTTNRVAGANTAFGLTNPSSCATRASARPVSARNRTDSGNFSARIGASSSGATPPTTNTDRQPNCGINAAASRPPSAAPTEKPQNMIITMVARRRRGLNSDVSAIAFGIAPPRPRPVRKRIASSVLTSWTKAVTSAPMPNASVDKMMIFLRPTRSASGPNTSAPIISPNRPALNTGPSAPLPRPHSLASAGATKPIAWVSKPSRNSTAAQVSSSLS